METKATTSYHSPLTPSDLQAIRARAEATTDEQTKSDLLRLLADLERSDKYTETLIRKMEAARADAAYLREVIKKVYPSTNGWVRTTLDKAIVPPNPGEPYVIEMLALRELRTVVREVYPLTKGNVYEALEQACIAAEQAKGVL